MSMVFVEIFLGVFQVVILSNHFPKSVNFEMLLEHQNLHIKDDFSPKNHVLKHHFCFLELLSSYIKTLNSGPKFKVTHFQYIIVC